MGKKLSKPGEEGSAGSGSPQKTQKQSVTENTETDSTRTTNTEGDDEDVGPLEDYDIDDQFSKSNNQPLTIDDFELLKVCFVYASNKQCLLISQWLIDVMETFTNMTSYIQHCYTML
jgi:hypothetical protein